MTGNRSIPRASQTARTSSPARPQAGQRIGVPPTGRSTLIRRTPNRSRTASGTIAARVASRPPVEVRLESPRPDRGRAIRCAAQGRYERVVPCFRHRVSYGSPAHEEEECPRALPEIPSLDDPHADTLVERRRAGRVLRVDVQHHAPEPTLGERRERTTQQGVGDPASAMGLQDPDLTDPATIAVDLCHQRCHRLRSVPRPGATSSGRSSGSPRSPGPTRRTGPGGIPSRRRTPR